jgi:nucleoside transporter
MDIYIPLSIVMFLEYAVWGAWAPVLAARLLGPLKMTGKQTGWIYATLPLACIISPLIAGQLADQWLNTEWILAAAHLIGAVLLLVAAKRQTFGSLFVVMLCYSFCFAATMPLVNSVLFTHVSDVATQGKVFIWAPVAWALVGYTLTGWRMSRKTEGDGSDCLIYAGLLSFVMAACCLLLPATPPAGTGEIPIVAAFSMLSEPNFLLFIVISMVVAGLMQFYFLGSAQFMQDMGIASKHVPASMGIAQAVQAAATWFVMGMFIEDLGFKWTLAAGASSWLVMYLIYVATKPRWLIVAGQSLHGLAYVLFIIVGQIFANVVAQPEIRGSVQALIFAATTGVGLFFGTQLAGIVMDRYAVDGKFQWRKVWLVPCLIMLAGVLALAIALREPPKAEEAAQAKPAVMAPVAQTTWDSIVP